MSWTPSDSEEIYLLPSWGEGTFGINSQGNVEVRATAKRQNLEQEPVSGRIDLYELTRQVRARGYAAPILFRFEGILRDRVRGLNEAFDHAREEFDYAGPYCGVYPIKVNQERHVVEVLMEEGRSHGMGLEVGSKPELFAGISLEAGRDTLMICNGYKDAEYVEMALLASKVSIRPVLVIEKYSELETILRASRVLGIRPTIGVRTKLNTEGTGRWQSSTGDRSKFGLTAAELVATIDRLRDLEMLDCLTLLHFHIGSQVSHIRSVKNAMREATCTLLEMSAMGVDIRYFDAGGGLGVDYDGTRTDIDSSRNYSVQEYASDIVYSLGQACLSAGINPPTIVTESGRALVAHHAVLVTEVIGVSSRISPGSPIVAPRVESQQARDLAELLPMVTAHNYQECYHDAKHLREESLLLYSAKQLSLRQKAEIEEHYWRALNRILEVTRELDYVPEEFELLERSLADTYFLNFSLFQSVPDSWAINQLFPVLPIHRHLERPDRHAVLADMTCDSDGKVDRFVSLHGSKHTLELHSVDAQEPYYLGFFLVGAYQEILGDLHNLFGDTNIIHVDLKHMPSEVRPSVIAEGADSLLSESTESTNTRPQLTHILRGERVKDVLAYVEYDEDRLLNRLRSEIESALDEGRIDYQESALLWRRYEEGLRGYTYLTRPGSNPPERTNPKDTVSEDSIRPVGRARVPDPR
ncbi:MAG: arginine decarboxylase [Planctomycetota bacterium]|jgi:arginine decarboxylase